ncbi:uncharacterized protein MYCFIDRAFT_77440 [Pseudocercospora fijiensis CIRAD86]|uniref:Zn(2)-C6 fungal-type domain-containing protein n=1 Tax=Pseudocercospora fijiensis (strain CIRAD86) TaxID=383855 RepID=M3BC40_PSEFD|nr:uncharacterized protein MYCFIDRAFT_77440 [Pseudocercospora fijiensis CIRAD86]EME86738.1 hypothetical protein MYCFIDRAFT_77440 [Pseudocercospora fijiensis CIRAD86]
MSSSSSSASTQPKIRGACENCHRRKIRCIIAPGDSACVNCVHSGSACLFAPRSKPGRPRRVTSDKPSTQGPEPHDIQGSSSSNPQRSSPEYDPHGIEHDLMQVADLDALDVEAAWNICWTPDEAISLPDPNAFAYSMLSHSLPKTSAWPRANMAGVPAYPLSPPASLGPSPSNESIDLDDLGFESALQVCKKLDEYCQYIAHPVFMPSVEHEVFSVMARICTVAASKAPAASHCPAAALILAAILKVLELCGLIVAKLSRQPPASPLGGGSMESMFLLKKIDLLLLQTKVFLAQIEHHAGVQKAVELHRHIETTVQTDYPAMAW